MSRLESRVEKLEATMAPATSDGEYDDWLDYLEHEPYVLSEDGSVMLLDLDFTSFPCEEDLWVKYPAGTKFWAIGGGYEVCDGVKRQLNFPDKDKPLSPETQAALDLVFAT